MTKRAARGRSFVPLAAALLLLAAPAAHAQEAERAAAERVHVEGGYPDDITVFEETTDDAASNGGGSSGGAGHGPQGTVSPHGDRDGGDASRTLDLPMPDWLRDLFGALGNLLGSQALQFLCLAVGVALLFVFVVYLVTLFRFPRRELAALRRVDRADAGHEALDPLLAETPDEPEEYARQGRYREAIHALFVRTLGRAARAGDVDRRGRTAREVASAIARLSHAPPELDELLSLTELVWFGGRPATVEQYAHAVSLASRTGVAPTTIRHAARDTEAP